MTMKMLGVSQKLPYPGKRALREQVAAKDAESGGYGLRETTNRIRATSSWPISISGWRTIRQLKSNRLILEQFLRIAEARYAVGQATQAEVLKAQTQLADDRGVAADGARAPGGGSRAHRACWAGAGRSPNRAASGGLLARSTSRRCRSPRCASARNCSACKA